MIKIGIVGPRGLATVEGFRSFEDVEITAFCDINEEILNNCAAAYNIPKKYRVYEDMLESDIDAVLIASPMQCHVPQADAKPAHEIPKGAKVERVVKVKVQPSSSAAVTALTSGSSPEADATIPPFNPVTVDMSLIRLKDQSRRVIASSPDGAIVGGVDIPVEAARQARALKWAAGGTWNPADRSWGAWVQRDVGPLVLGADALQVREPVQSGGRLRWVGLVRAGIRW